MIRTSARLTAVVFAAVLLLGRVATSSEALTVQQWQEDLRTFIEKAPTIHKNLFHSLTRQQFEAAVHGLSARIPTLSRNQIIVELMKIVASVGDGHTYVSLLEPPLSFRRYGLKLYEFPDGVYVVLADPKYRAVVGGRVVKIGKTPFEQAYRAISEVVPRDNAMQVKSLGPHYALIPEILDGLRLADDVENLPLTVVKDNKQVRVVLRPAPSRQIFFHGWDAEAGWEDAHAPSSPVPLWLQAPAEAYWFKYLAEEKILYVQYNQVRNKDDEPLDEFFKQVMAFAESHPVERFVLDVRLNGGGNNYLNRPIIHGFIRSDKVNQPGRLFTIIGRQTFSAAMNFVNAMKLNTQTLFVGEPTGARPNMYGDNAPLTLPNSRIQIRLSTLWWQDMDPRDLRPHQAPDLAADLTIEDYRAGRDPALEVIGNYDPRKSPQQTIRAALSRRDWGEAKKVMLANKANPLLRYASFERSVNSKGYELLSKRSFDDAIEVFKLNVEVYPDSWNAYDSLAQAYAARHDVSKEDLRLAEENYRKSLRLNPGNARATAELEGLKQR